MLKLGDAEAAKVDCSRVLARVPNNAKALFRRAQAELALKVCTWLAKNKDQAFSAISQLCGNDMNASLPERRTWADITTSFRHAP